MRRILVMSMYLVAVLVTWQTSLWLVNDHLTSSNPWKTTLLHPLALPIFPIHAILGFGFYSLFIIAYNLITFRECPQAAEDLAKDILAARAGLRKMGFALED